MKMSNLMIQSIMLSLIFTLVSGQAHPPYRSTSDLTQYTGQFEQSILNPNRFKMNQSFSFSTSMVGGMSQTSGIYSNFSSYQFSEQINFSTSLHLIQNQNNMSNSSGQQTGIGYELGLEYQLSPNSIFSLQVMNYRNSPIFYHHFAPFNVP